MRLVIKISKIALLTIGIILALFVTLVAYFQGIKANDLRLQRRHMKELEAYYASTSFTSVEESQFVEFSLTDNDLRFNEIRMLASHNSYKKKGPMLGKLFVGLGDSFEEAKALAYGNKTLTEQLNLGIRSFELDVRYRRGAFEITHVPLVDNSSVAVDLALAFEEIAMWSNNHPNHIPIVLLIELKYDWMMLDPSLKDITMKELEELDDLNNRVFDDLLYTPKDLMGNYPSMRERLDTDSWPLLNELLGKVFVVLHPGRMTSEYATTDPTFQTQTMFPALSNMDVDHSYRAFVVHNSPNVENITTLLEYNLIVRTRMDSSLIQNEAITQQALASNAQIVTTDFHPGHRFKDVAVVYLKDTYTVIARDNS